MPDGMIYLTGGCDGAQNCFTTKYGTVDCGCSSVTNNVVAYDPRTDAYTQKTPMPEPRYRHAVCALGNYIIVLGGKTLLPDSSGNGYFPGMLNDNDGARDSIYVRAAGPRRRFICYRQFWPRSFWPRPLPIFSIRW